MGLHGGLEILPGRGALETDEGVECHAQPFEGLLQGFVTGSAPHRTMEREVFFRDSEVIALCDLFAHVTQVMPQLTRDVIGKIFGRKMECQKFQMATNFHQLLNLPAAEDSNRRAAIRNPDDEAEMLELQQGFAHWDLADLQLLRKVRFA